MTPSRQFPVSTATPGTAAMGGAGALTLPRTVRLVRSQTRPQKLVVPEGATLAARLDTSIVKVRAAAVCCTLFVRAPVLAHATGRIMLYVRRTNECSFGGRCVGRVRSLAAIQYCCFASVIVRSASLLAVSYTFTAIVLHRTDDVAD